MNITFNILISTTGRPSLQRMIDSFLPQLTSYDHVTIVFDGVSPIPIETYNSPCKIHIYEESSQLGFWGHGVRNKYAHILEPTTFVMHADDDDIYLPNAFTNLRKLCTNGKTLYIAQMIHKDGSIIPPTSVYSRFKTIKFSKIGTPCGIIPYYLNTQSVWEYVYGGDYSFYKKLESIVRPTYINCTIYKVLT